MDSWLKNLTKKITTPKKIVFPEGNSLAVVQAAYQAYSEGICRTYLIGDKATIKNHCITLDIPSSDWWTHLIPEEMGSTLLSEEAIQSLPIDSDALSFLLEDPLFFSVALLCTDKIDAVVAGYDYTTGEVVSAGNMFLNKEDAQSLASSFFVMDIPNYKGSEKNLLIFADCGVNVEPNAEEIARIAIDTAQSANILLDWTPRVALLSSSTKGSIDHENVDKMKEALSIAHSLSPALLIDGELQGDAALDSTIAKKKVGSNSLVAGNANILVFPNLDAGNIAYKLTSQLAGAKAYGPLLQGFSHPLFDLSRGSSAQEIYGVIKIAAVFAENRKPI